MEELNKDKDKEKKEEKKETKEESFVKNNESEPIKIKIGTVGNFIFAAFIVLIIGTGALTYYLIHQEKENVKEIVSNLPENIVNTSVQDNATNEVVDSIANIIDSAISDVTNSSTNNTSAVADASNTRKILNEELVVLYNGLILDTSKMDEVTLKYIDNTSDAADKYVITYYNYENYGFKEPMLGILSTQLYEGLVKIDNVGKVAISEDYNAIPRQVKVVNTVPTIVSDNNPNISEYNSVKTLIVDLDGNQTDEYILILANKTTGFSKITLVDSKGAKIGDLASIEKSKWKKDSTAEYYLNINNVEVLDIDNDGIMEIMVEIPQAVGNPTVSLLKYNNGVLQGKKDIECSLVVEENQ